MDIAKELQTILSEDAVLSSSNESYAQYLQRWSDIDKGSPAAIVLPKTEEECRDQIRWTSKNKVPFVIKSGGMSPYSTAGSNGIVIDLSKYHGIQHDEKSQTAVLTGSVSAKTVAVELAKDGCCTTLPSGNPIGAIPFLLNGGNSPLVSQLGYGSDLIVAARLITAKGDLIVVDEENNTDLFYAIRGAGQYFGLVTQLTIRTFPFGETLANDQGTVWSGRFIFPLDRAQEVFTTMKHVVSNPRYATSGLIMIAAPPPAFKPAIAVLPKLIGKDACTLQQEAFKTLYDLQPLVSGGSDVPIQNVADALDPVCQPGGYKKLQLKGLYDLEPDLLAEAAGIWTEMTSEYPDAKGSYFSFQWDSRGPKAAPFESANGMHHVKYWANMLLWCREAGSVDGVQGYVDQAFDVLRRNQKADEYVDFANGDKGDRIERRYLGRERLQKLRGLKREWDPEGVFSRELL